MTERKGWHYTPLPDMPIFKAMERAREDIPFFSHYFCGRELHDGQVDYVVNANASINLLCTSNRWGKTTVLTIRHLHPLFFKLGGEPKYIIDGAYHHDRYLGLEYKTVHAANLWETAEMVWRDALNVCSGARMRPFVAEMPKSLPPKIVLTNGATWLFRPVGDRGEGLDGKSFYHISIDEAGWITNLREIMENVARIRIADVRGTIDLAGTFKKEGGMSRDFYQYARRASLATGIKMAFDHRDGNDYLKTFGLIPPKEAE